MTSVEGWRRLALGLLLFGMTGVLGELTLLEHHEDWRQWIPLVALGVGWVAGAIVLARPSRAAVRILQLTMLGYLAAATAGIYFHLKANLEFELELHPSMAGTELWVEVLKGAMPALAPGTMAQLGLLGLLACFRHPALASDGRA